MNDKRNHTHTIFHHLAMIIYSEILNLVWTAVGLTLISVGWVLFNFTNEAFYRIAIGLPVLLMGVSLTLFKIHEIILVIVNPKRLKAICVFCNDGK